MYTEGWLPHFFPALLSLTSMFLKSTVIDHRCTQLLSSFANPFIILFWLLTIWYPFLGIASSLVIYIIPFHLFLLLNFFSRVLSNLQKMLSLSTLVSHLGSLIAQMMLRPRFCVSSFLTLVGQLVETERDFPGTFAHTSKYLIVFALSRFCGTGIK